MTSFDVSTTDRKSISDIADRAVSVLKQSGVNADLLTIAMDLTAVHANIYPLRLAEMLEADDFDLIHDVAGIARHLNRNDCVMMDCFVPRFREPDPNDWAPPVKS